MNSTRMLVGLAVTLAIPVSAGCPGGGGSTPRVIAKAPCASSQLTMTVDTVINQGQTGGQWLVDVKVTVNCAGEGVAATFYVKLGGLEWKEGQTGTDGKASKQVNSGLDPTGTEIRVEVYGNDSDDPAQELTVTVPAAAP